VGSKRRQHAADAEGAGHAVEVRGALQGCTHTGEEDELASKRAKTSRMVSCESAAAGHPGGAADKAGGKDAGREDRMDVQVQVKAQAERAVGVKIEAPEGKGQASDGPAKEGSPPVRHALPASRDEPSDATKDAAMQVEGGEGVTEARDSSMKPPSLLPKSANAGYFGEVETVPGATGGTAAGGSGVSTPRQPRQRIPHLELAPPHVTEAVRECLGVMVSAVCEQVHNART